MNDEGYNFCDADAGSRASESTRGRWLRVRLSPLSKLRIGRREIHGTIGCYRDGCRCVNCIAGQAAWTRKNRAINRATMERVRQERPANPAQVARRAEYLREVGREEPHIKLHATP